MLKTYSITYPPVDDATHFGSLAGVLHYLTFTRPGIAYVIQQFYLHMHDLREPHLTPLKWVLALSSGHSMSWSSLPIIAELVIYTDADWAGCPDIRRSTSGYAVFLGDSLVSWPSKHQNTVSRSSVEAEYRAVANGMGEACWLR
jgi:hypothetical protein